MNCQACSVETIDILCNTCLEWSWQIAYFHRSWHWNELHLASINHRLFQVYGDGADQVGDWPERTYVIKFHDGFTITTNKVIHFGEIPLRFRKRLPTNATFLNPRQRCINCGRRYVPTLSNETCYHCTVQGRYA